MGFPRQENWKYIGGDSSWAKLKQFLCRKQELPALKPRTELSTTGETCIFSNCPVRRGTPRQSHMWSSCIRTEEWKYKRQSFCKGEKIPITYKRQNEGYAETRHQLAASGTLMQHCKVWADKTLASCEGAVAKRGKASVLRSCNVSVEVLPASMRLFIHPNFPYTLLKDTSKRVHPIKITFWCPSFTLFFFFWCGPFLNSLLNLLQYLFCFGFSATRYVGSWLPNQGLNPHPLHWKVKSQPLEHQESPLHAVLNISRWTLEPACLTLNSGSTANLLTTGLLPFCVSIFLFIKWGVLLVCTLWLAFISKLVNIRVNCLECCLT